MRPGTNFETTCTYLNSLPLKTAKFIVNNDKFEAINRSVKHGNIEFIFLNGTYGEDVNIATYTMKVTNFTAEDVGGLTCEFWNEKGSYGEKRFGLRLDLSEPDNE